LCEALAIIFGALGLDAVAANEDFGGLFSHVEHVFSLIFGRDFSLIPRFEVGTFILF
jgi:hypothetical protein